MDGLKELVLAVLLAALLYHFFGVDKQDTNVPSTASNGDALSYQSSPVPQKVDYLQPTVNFESTIPFEKGTQTEIKSPSEILSSVDIPRLEPRIFEEKEIVSKASFNMHETPNSSCFSEIGYNEATEQLRVCFRTSGYYIYSNFSKADYDSFNNAESLGTYFNNYIKGKYPYEKEYAVSYNSQSTYLSDYYEEDYDNWVEYEPDGSDVYDWYVDHSDYDEDYYEMDMSDYFEANYDSILENYYDSLAEEYYENMVREDYYDW